MTGIRIQREANAYADRRRKYRILVDGEELGAIGRGDTIDIPLDPGRHSVWMRIDWTGSEMATFVLEADETIEFVCRPRYPTAAVVVALLRSIKDRDDWIVLERM
ncbi:MAG TPA: hypothetical protein VHW74_07480 [Mycobacteriales bacterium]|jgi:hypothetical protein|nr:hypothetical protein [Mycobacteriales bacterium]